MHEKDNYLKTAELSTEQNCNMIDGVPNNTPIPPTPPELDDLSGRIARQLYQKSSIAVQGYEKTAFPDNFFDVAIGNVPFGQFHVADKRYDRLNFPIHEYFVAKALDQVRRLLLPRLQPSLRPLLRSYRCNQA